jgi:hypothetical protein
MITTMKTTMMMMMMMIMMMTTMMTIKVNFNHSVHIIIFTFFGTRSLTIISLALQKKKKTDWRRQHEDFINNIRYAKTVTHMEAQGMDVSHIAPPPTTQNPDLVPCPNCGRSFNESAAERHIPRCRDLKTKPASKRR